jgi:hypothetical protein
VLPRHPGALTADQLGSLLSLPGYLPIDQLSQKSTTHAEKGDGTPVLPAIVKNPVNFQLDTPACSETASPTVRWANKSRPDYILDEIATPPFRPGRAHYHGAQHRLHTAR